MEEGREKEVGRCPATPRIFGNANGINPIAGKVI
jgi:hypothetical protein